jgi:predicted dinucleotide-binding enzyme
MTTTKKTTITFSAEVGPALYRTWNAIAYDLMECGEVDNEMAMEACVDCDRMLVYGDSEAAYHEVKSLIKQHGWRAVIEALAAIHKFC